MQLLCRLLAKSLTKLTRRLSRPSLQFEFLMRAPLSRDIALLLLNHPINDQDATEFAYETYAYVAHEEED